MKHLPTDRQVLKCIYLIYENDYPGKKIGSKGENDPFVPIDLRIIGNELKITPELVFGRLYFHLETKYRLKQESGAWVNLFVLDIENKGHSINFPYLTAILAGYEQEYRKQLWTMVISCLALAISVASLAVNLITKIQV